MKQINQKKEEEEEHIMSVHLGLAGAWNSR